MKTSSLRARVLLRGALFLVLPVLPGMLGPGIGRAEALPEPHLEMKAAAEALADVDPEAILPPPRSETARVGAAHVKEAAAGSARLAARAELHDAVRSAVRDEIQQEVGSTGRGPLAVGAPAARRGAQGESARSDAARANDAASQAQQARLNREVSRSRDKSQGKPLISTPAPAAGRS